MQKIIGSERLFMLQSILTLPWSLLGVGRIFELKMKLFRHRTGMLPGTCTYLTCVHVNVLSLTRLNLYIYTYTYAGIGNLW